MKALSIIFAGCLLASAVTASPDSKSLLAERRVKTQSAPGLVFSHLNTLLTSGVPAPLSLPAVSTPTLFAGDNGFRIVVPSGATRLEVRLTGVPSSTQFAIGLRFGTDFQGSTFNNENGGIGNENPVVVTTSSNPALRAGTYFIGILVLTASSPTNGTITATVTTGPAPGPGPAPVPGTGPLLTSGVPATFNLPSVTQPTLFAGDFSFRIVVPEGATQLEVRLVTATPNTDVDLFVRFGADVALSGGRAVADYRSEGLTGNETIVVTPSSSPPLRSGTYFISLGLFDTGRSVTGTVTATVTTPQAPPPPQPPAIAASTTSLNFTAQTGSNPPSQTFTVRNSGGGTLDFQITTNQSWLSVAPNRGTSTGQAVTITVSLAASNLAGGTHDGEIRISQSTVAATAAQDPSQAGPVVIAVRLTITAAATPDPRISAGGAINAASAVARFAADAIVSLFGSNLATSLAVAETTPLPTVLAGTTVRVTDSNRTERQALLFFVSAGQINFVIPEGTAEGTATITVTRSDGRSATTTIRIDRVGPGLFSANADGRGAAAALAIRVAADGTQSQVPVFQCGATAGSCTPVAIDPGPPSEQIILLLFGTGIRGRSSLSNVRAEIGGELSEVLYAGPQGAFVGLDQVNVPLSRNLLARGEVDVLLRVDGAASNRVRINVGGTPPPVLTSLNPARGELGQTIDTLAITGRNLASVTALEFTPADGIAATDIQASATTLTARLSIASDTFIGGRAVALVSPAGRSNTRVFTVLKPGPSSPPVISNVAIDDPQGRLGEPITLTGSFDFSDPDGDIVFAGALEGSAAMRFRLDRGFPLGVCTLSLTGPFLHRPGETSGTIRFSVTYSASSVTFTTGTSVGVGFSLIDLAGNQSNVVDPRLRTFFCGN